MGSFAERVKRIVKNPERSLAFVGALGTVALLACSSPNQPRAAISPTPVETDCSKRGIISEMNKVGEETKTGFHTLRVYSQTKEVRTGSFTLAMEPYALANNLVDARAHTSGVDPEVGTDFIIQVQPIPGGEYGYLAYINRRANNPIPDKIPTLRLQGLNVGECTVVRTDFNEQGPFASWVDGRPLVGLLRPAA